MWLDPKVSSLTLIHFECFVTVVELGTTLKAAEALHISQPQVSQKISQLENSLDVTLFTRENHRLILTGVGQLFLARCRKMLEDFNSSLVELRPYCNTDKIDALRIGFTEGQEPGDILSWLRDFKAQFPETITNPVIVRWVDSIEKILCGEIDLCIVIDVGGLCDNPNIQSLIICPLPLHCIVRRDSLLSHKKVLQFSDLDGCTCYYPSYQRNTKIQNESQELFQKQVVNIRWESKDADFFALRRYLDTEKSCFLTYSSTIEDSTLKTYTLGGITKPLVVAWKKSKTAHLKSYAVELAEIIKRLHLSNTES
ncbi:LysR family transcriptional regulator [Anaerotruncus rubiinfantis]|uniref:LysR family transcriptional regulator n=1 Tax=Anaerotruncus rubiinfantis TaxID=1720200 RepID=UPI00082A46D6|nr:LysR family transcriptional regulator [Anaerotruncus rubiinfantis]